MNNGKIAVSVFDSHAEPLLQKVKAASLVAKIVEIRFDYLNQSELFPAVSKLVEPKLSTPLIATFRPKEQGGKRDLTLEERLKFWEFAAGKFWGADVEEDIADAVRNFKLRICSFHEFSGATNETAPVFERLRTKGCEVVKIAEAAGDACDSLGLWKTFIQAVSAGDQFIPVAMGEAGKWTRILGLAHGAFLTYSASTDDSPTAPGQFTTDELMNVFRARELNKSTRVYGILAGSTSYSMSPYIQNVAFREAKLNSVFVPLQVKDLESFFRRMVRPRSREIDLNFRGFSVTIPHKISVVEHLDVVDSIAGSIGAVNTVFIEDGKLAGTNTDAEGFIVPLRSQLGGVKGSRVAVVGSGGAARACVYALKKDGADVVLFARDLQNGRRLAEEFSASFSSFDTGGRNDFSKFDVVVNATPLGTAGLLEDATIATADQLGGCRFVYDLVYNPPKTRLIREAELAGVPAINGIEMLIAQGAKQFEIWTGQRPSVEVMKAAALKRLTATE
jgi:3-dehydroquinate dehydratase/shikimate dehydrogenase